ncbi:MAG: LEA/WHy family protein [Planctomycetota bacterium]|jgi:LEA14-like dessication related protein
MEYGRHVILMVVLVSAFWSGCATIQEALKVEKPTASLKGLKFADITLESATLLFDVEVENPYPVVLPLLNMDYALASGVNKLLSGDADIQTTIPAKDKKVVSLPATVAYLDLVKAFKDIRPGSKIPYKADVGLSVDTPALGTIRLPLDKEGELSVPTIPKIDEIDWKKILLDKSSAD